MEQRHITLDEIEQAMLKGKLNDRKSEPREKPWPKYVIDAEVRNKSPQNKNAPKYKDVEIVVSVNDKETVIITVIDKDTDWPVEESSHNRH